MQANQGKINKNAGIKLAKQYIEMCQDSGIRISKAFLFGSTVNRTSDQDSDVDVLLVSTDFINNTLENWRLLAPITAKLYDVEPHPYPEKKFKKGDPFIDEIKRTGIEIKLD